MNNIMTYKGYWAEIKYSDKDGCFYGTIEGLPSSSISFEGQNVKELRKDFEEAVDSYLESCKAHNEIPEIQCKGSLNVRLGTELHTKAKIKSIEMNISINELIKKAVDAYVK